MIAVDSNILVYAHRRDSNWHAQAAARLRELAEAGRPWMIPWPCAHEFLAIVTHPRIYSPPSATAAALRQIEAWIESPTLVLAAETPHYWPVLSRLIDKAKPTGGQVHDARVAALCIDHGADLLWTADRDFSRFTEIRTLNPLLT